MVGGSKKGSKVQRGVQYFSDVISVSSLLTSRGVLRGAIPNTDDVEEAVDFSLAASDLSDLVLPGVSAAPWNGWTR